MIELCVRDNYLDTLHYYFKLRSQYRNRVIFNFTYKKAFDILNISMGATHKHVKRMIDLNWLELQNCGNLRAVGIDKLNEKHENKLILKVPAASSKKEQLMHFRYALLHNNLNRQEVAIHKKTSTVNKAKSNHLRVSKKDIYYINKSGGLKKYEKSLQNRTTLSNRSIGKIFNRSTVTGQRYQQQLNKFGLIRSNPYFDIVKDRQSAGSITQARKQTECYYLKLVGSMIVKQRTNTITKTWSEANVVYQKMKTI